MITCFSIIYHASAFAVFLNIFLFLTLATTPIAFSKHYLENIGLALLRMIPLPSDEPIGINDEVKSKASSKFNNWLKVGIIPLLILILFFIFYSNSIPGFLNFFSSIFDFFPKIELTSVLILLFGFVIAIYFWRNKQESLGSYTSWFQSNNLVRKKYGEFNGLTTRLELENKRHLLTLFVLILMISLALILDIKYLFFSTNSEPDYAEMQWAVRQGTIGLILSILGSIFLAVYVFRGNLSFYRKSALLKKLTLLWLCLNIALCLSLAYRTSLYIEHYNMAYKRLAVIAFIIAAVTGLISVIYKIVKSKNASFLFRLNIHSVLIISVLFSIPNWDSIIVRYNMAHPKAFIDYDFIYTRDLSAVIPYTDNPEIMKLKIGNYENYSWLSRKYGSINYQSLIERRIEIERQNLEQSDWRSWNYNRMNLKILLEEQSN